MIQHRSPELRDRMIKWARDILAHKDEYIVLDTETSGLNRNDVILQIAIIDLDGNELLNSLVKPTKKKRISAEATAIHGIKMPDLSNSPTFAELIPQINEIVAGKKVIIYNAEYDRRLIEQTCHQDRCISPSFEARCAMQVYSHFVGKFSEYHYDYRYQKLPGGDHTAIGDCRATLNVIHKMAQAELAIPDIPREMGSPSSDAKTDSKKWWMFWRKN